MPTISDAPDPSNSVLGEFAPSLLNGAKEFVIFYEGIKNDELAKSRHPGENRGPEGF